MKRSTNKAIKESCSSGWLSPEGDYWPCEHAGHAALADYLSNNNGYRGEKILEERGWIKVSTNKWYALGQYPLSQRQVDFVFDWCKLNGKQYPPDHVKLLVEDMDNNLL